MWTLLHLKYKRHIFADDGVGGGRQQSTGAEGKDVIVRYLLEPSQKTVRPVNQYLK